MRITIAERLTPFSHIPGTYCVLPGTNLRFQIFPTLIRIHDLNTAIPTLIKEIELNILGPVTEFTVQLDLEKMCLRVWGQSALGFMRYVIYAAESVEGFGIKIEKNPEQALFFDRPASKGFSTVLERLSLGSSKALDWSFVKRRHDFSEVLPVWFRLGQTIVKIPHAKPEGASLILHDCQRKIIEGNVEKVLTPFSHLFQAGFEGILSPRLVDTDYQGFDLPTLNMNATLSSLVLLRSGADLIRSLFFSYNDGMADILPALPVQFHCGRFLGLECGDYGILDMEWTKKSIRRMIFTAKKNGGIRFGFQRHLKTFRLRHSENDRGVRLESRTPIEIEAGKVYIIDRFEK